MRDRRRRPRARSKSPGGVVVGRSSGMMHAYTRGDGGVVYEYYARENAQSETVCGARCFVRERFTHVNITDVALEGTTESTRREAPGVAEREGPCAALCPGVSPGGNSTSSNLGEEIISVGLGAHAQPRRRVLVGERARRVRDDRRRGVHADGVHEARVLHAEALDLGAQRVVLGLERRVLGLEGLGLLAAALPRGDGVEAVALPPGLALPLLLAHLRLLLLVAHGRGGGRRRGRGGRRRGGGRRLGQEAREGRGVAHLLQRGRRPRPGRRRVLAWRSLACAGNGCAPAMVSTGCVVATGCIASIRCTGHDGGSATSASVLSPRRRTNRLLQLARADRLHDAAIAQFLFVLVAGIGLRSGTHGGHASLPG